MNAKPFEFSCVTCGKEFTSVSMPAALVQIRKHRDKTHPGTKGRALGYRFTKVAGKVVRTYGGKGIAT